MPDLDATAGGVSANSYITVAEADAYFAVTFGRPLWADQVEDTKEVLLIQASRTLDQYMEWVGAKATDTQSMDWPRTSAYNRDQNLLPSDDVPLSVKYASMELAYHILANGGISFEAREIDRVKVGPIDIEFNRMPKDSGFPLHVEQLLYHLGTSELADPGSMTTVRLIRT